LEVSADALVTHTAALRRVELVPPRSPVGRSTVEAIQSGLIYGYGGLVDGLVDRIKEAVGEDCPVVATGGLAELMVGVARTINVVEPDLTLIGLAEIYRLN
jgi:type III pantothenate kinase